MWKLIALGLLLGVAPGRADEADLLVYAVKESGLPRYLSRILVTDAFVRIDEGQDSPNGYTLYNRVSHIIYNVDPEDETVLILTPPDRQPVKPDSLRLEEKVLEDPDAPTIAGRRPRKLELYTNGRLCRTLQTVEGLMPRAVQGLLELRLALARLQGVPGGAEAPDPCQLSEYLYAPGRALAHGLPLLDSMEEKRQWLVDFRAGQVVSGETFQVPGQYQQVVPPPLGPE